MHIQIYLRYTVAYLMHRYQVIAARLLSYFLQDIPDMR